MHREGCWQIECGIMIDVRLLVSQGQPHSGTDGPDSFSDWLRCNGPPSLHLVCLALARLLSLARSGINRLVLWRPTNDETTCVLSSHRSSGALKSHRKRSSLDSHLLGKSFWIYPAVTIASTFITTSCARLLLLVFLPSIDCFDFVLLV